MRVMHASRASCVKDFDPDVILLRLRRDRSRLSAKHVEEKNRPREKEREGEERNNTSIKSARQQASLQALNARASREGADLALYIYI